MKKPINNEAQGRGGAILPLVAIVLPVILIFAAYSINIAQMQLTRTELRTATDSASRAGARTLSITQSRLAAEQFAIEAASRNQVAGTPLLLESSDLQFGLSQPGDGTGRWGFTAATGAADPLNSLRVTGRRTTDSPSGGVHLLFPAFSRGPFEPVKSATATQIDRDICLVLDRSGSMTDPVTATDTPNTWKRGQAVPANSKWLDLVAAVDAFLDALENTPQDEQVGLVTYATTAAHERDLSLNYQRIRDTMDDHSDAYRGGRTAVGDGTFLGYQAVSDPNFARNFAEKTIVVMTDGRHNEGRFPDTVAAWAHETFGVTVHTITFGPGANQSLMRKTATAGGGRHWHAATTESLIDVFEEIANNLPTLITE